MNHIQLPSLSPMAWALPDARRLAQEAIANHDRTRLEQMLDSREVDANTTTAEGGTLLMEAVRHLNMHAFGLLARDPEDIDINGVDADGNTVLHHVARRMSDNVMNVEWEQLLSTLLEQIAPDIDWDLADRNDQTVLDLSAEYGHEQIADLLHTYTPKVEESQASQSAHVSSDTDEEVFSDVGSEHFENLTPQEQARVLSLYEHLLQQKRQR